MVLRLCFIFALLSLGCSNPYERDNPKDPIHVYSVTFTAADATGGTPPPTITGSYGDTIQLPDGGTFERDGYVFARWSHSDGKSYSVGGSYIITGNTAMNAVWVPAYTVTFDGNGATGGTAPEAVKVIAGSAAIQLPGRGTLERTGYSFGGWNAVSPYTVASNTTLYAKWIPVYTVTFDGNGATGGTAPEAVKADSGSAAAVQLPGGGTLERAGYSFGGWNAVSPYTIKGDTTLYAKWIPVYTVTFDGNGATGGTAPAAMKADSGSAAIQLPNNGTLQKTGFSFGGWNAKSPYTVTGNITLYAKWIPVYTVTFDGNGATGGTAPAAVKADSGSAAIQLPGRGTLERTGYSFVGWNADSPYAVTGDITLYAKWIRTYTVTFDGNGATRGTAPVAIKADSGSAAIQLPGRGTLERTGYSFIGWNADSPYAVTGDITLYAKWIPVYTVTFDGNGATSGTAPAAIKADSGSAAIQLPGRGTLERTWFSFIGWTTDISGEGDSYEVGSSYTVADDITLYALWVPGCTAKDNTTTHYCSEGIKKEYGSVTHSGQTYKTVVIGTQTWMAENLNYNATGSKCYGNIQSNCAKYGRLYTWATAKTVCPSGWHLPSRAEWEVMTAYIGDNTGKKLKAISGWNNLDNGTPGNGTDDYGFSAMPGGYGSTDGNSYSVGDFGEWWSSTEYSSTHAYDFFMSWYQGDAYNNGTSGKSFLKSVRCLQDAP